jgi:hypothetical protein
MVITNPIRAGEAGELADIISRRRGNNVNGGLLFNSGLPINYYRAQSSYHQVKANFIYELPFGNKRRFLNRGGFAGALVGGFQLDGIVR